MQCLAILRIPQQGSIDAASRATETLLHSLSQIAATDLRRIAAFGYFTFFSLIASLVAHIALFACLFNSTFCIVWYSALGIVQYVGSVSVLVPRCKHLLCSTCGQWLYSSAVKTPFPD